MADDDHERMTRTKSVPIIDSHMSYTDTGEGAPILFLHGNPTSSLLWRDIVPMVSQIGRCIAPDLIGFGASGKPDIAYRLDDHARYLDAFIKQLGLDDVVVVGHDWGSALGLDWARRHERAVRGLVLMEFITPVPTWRDFPAAGAELFRTFRDPGRGRTLLVEQNAFIEKILPGGILRTLPPAVMEAYRAPFRNPASREPIFRFPSELPIAGAPADVWAMATAYHDWLLATELPKLLFHVAPGALIPPDRARWYERNLKSCRSISLGAGGHYLQEDHADAIASSITSWLKDWS